MHDDSPKDIGDMELHSLPPTRPSSCRSNIAGTSAIAGSQMPTGDPSPTGPYVDEKKSNSVERLAEATEDFSYPTKPKLVILTIALMVAVFMIGLDTYIVGEPRRCLTRLVLATSDLACH